MKETGSISKEYMFTNQGYTKDVLTRFYEYLPIDRYIYSIDVEIIHVTSWYYVKNLHPGALLCPQF